MESLLESFEFIRIGFFTIQNSFFADVFLLDVRKRGLLNYWKLFEIIERDM